MAFNHRELCEIAYKWMFRCKSQRGPGCVLALVETKSGFTGEVPDVIGWRVAYGKPSAFDCVVVEVKTSLSDFLADAKKPHRIDPSSGMGVYRYYFAPAGVIPLESLPANWGLVEVNARGHIKVQKGHVIERYSDEAIWRCESNMIAEHNLLCSTLTRVKDPQKLQNMIREASNRASALGRELEREREAHRRTQQKLLFGSVPLQ